MTLQQDDPDSFISGTDAFVSVMFDGLRIYIVKNVKDLGHLSGSWLLVVCINAISYIYGFL